MDGFSEKMNRWILLTQNDKICYCMVTNFCTMKQAVGCKRSPKAHLTFQEGWKRGLISLCIRYSYFS